MTANKRKKLFLLGPFLTTWNETLFRNDLIYSIYFLQGPSV